MTTRIESADAALELVTRLRDAKGAVVAEAKSSASNEVKQTLTVRGAHANAATAYIGAIRGWPQTAWAPDALTLAM